MTRNHHTTLMATALATIFFASMVTMAYMLVGCFRPDEANLGNYSLQIDDTREVLGIAMPAILAWVALFNFGVLMGWWQRRSGAADDPGGLCVDDNFRSIHDYHGVGVEPVGYIGVGADQD